MAEIHLAIVALSDPTRFAVFECIRVCGGQAHYDCETGLCDAGDPGGIALCEVKCAVPCAPSTLTHHLNCLRDAGLIVSEKRGRQVYCAVIPARLKELSDFFAQNARPCNCKKD